MKRFLTTGPANASAPKNFLDYQNDFWVLPRASSPVLPMIPVSLEEARI